MIHNLSKWPFSYNNSIFAFYFYLSFFLLLCVAFYFDKCKSKTIRKSPSVEGQRRRYLVKYLSLLRCNDRFFLYLQIKLDKSLMLFLRNLFFTISMHFAKYDHFNCMQIFNIHNLFTFLFWLCFYGRNAGVWANGALQHCSSISGK